MADIYETLGVRRNASLAQIRAAYRRKAKKAHPDTGGSQEAFQALKLAHDILTNPDLRARYDATGAIGEVSPDNTEAEALQKIAATLDAELGQIVSQGLDPVTRDLVKALKSRFGVAKIKLRENLADMERSRPRAAEIERRFTAKNGPNRMSAIMAAMQAQMAEQTRRWEREIVIIDRAISILNDHEFRVDPEDPRWGRIGNMRYFTVAG